MNAAQTKRMLKEIPVSKSVMLVAKHGIGKSSVVKQVAQELGIDFHDVRLSQCEVGDIKGLPWLDEANLRTKFLKPDWWPRDPESKGILFFDEMNRAPKDVLQAVFEICLDRRLDGEALPAGWRVVAAINADDDYDVVELDPALMDRWFYIDFDPTPKEWMNWATANGIHPSIVDFLSQFTEYLDPPVGNLQAGRIYWSRRSWVQFHDTAKALGLWETNDDALMTQIAKGWLGEGVAVKFPKFYMHEFSHLSGETILDDLEKVRGKVEAAVSDIEVIASLSNSVINELKKRTAATLAEAQCKNIKNFMRLLPKDVASSFWVDLLAVPKMKKHIQEWQSDKDFATFIRTVYVS